MVICKSVQHLRVVLVHIHIVLGLIDQEEADAIIIPVAPTAVTTKFQQLLKPRVLSILSPHTDPALDRVPDMRNTTDSQGKKGFTIIELIIVASIIVMMSGVTVAFYNEFNNKKVLDAEGSKLVDVLELAKQKSIHSEISPQCNGSSYTFAGYSVVITRSGYSLKAVCPSNPTIQQYSFDTSVQSNTNTTITFNPIYGSVSSLQTIPLSTTNNTNCYSITVTTTGNITGAKLVCGGGS